uniref:Olfactory receptor family 56 subfamily A member 3 n=1 Tax=Bos indicus x Bos taurus TaxID=30522 RepID=A0A4W2GHE1_BOBOX
MTSHRNGSTRVSNFLLNCFVKSPNWQLWLSMPLSILFLLAMGANATLLVTIRLEASLHEPMYYLLSLLSLLDMALCLTVIPKVPAIFWFDLRSISFVASFVQMYIMNCFLTMESCTFMVMAYDRYVAICHQLRYPSIITEQFIAKVAIFILARNALITMYVSILSRHYCSRNEIDHCLCSNLGVTSLACDNITINRFYHLALAWFVVGSDMGLVFASYMLIIRSVLRLNSAEATSKALSTCSSHLTLILFFYTAVIVVSVTHLAGRQIPIIPVLLNVLHSVIPPALNPMVYALRTQELRVGFQRLIGLGEKMPRK